MASLSWVPETNAGLPASRSSCPRWAATVAFHDQVRPVFNWVCVPPELIPRADTQSMLSEAREPLAAPDCAVHDMCGCEDVLLTIAEDPLRLVDRGPRTHDREE